MNNPKTTDSSLDHSTPTPGEEKKESVLESLGAAIGEIVTGAVPDESLAEAGHDKQPGDSAATPAAKPALKPR